MKRISDVIAALKDAKSGGRPLDADVYEALGFEVKREPQRISGNATRYSRGWAYLVGARWVALGRVTFDPGDAIYLCERHLPGAEWMISNNLRSGVGHFAEVILTFERGRGGYCGVAASAPLALCIALLRAIDDQKAAS